jgi:uncharacterized membrane protein YgcG
MIDNIMKFSVFILSVLFSAGLSAQKGDLNMSRWHLSDNVESSDYKLIKKAGLYYSISNDNDNIYIDMKVQDQRVQNMILKEGLTIWINMDGKSVKKMGVRFPLGSQKDSPLSSSNTIELIGFIGEQERHFPADNPDNFRGSVKYDGVTLHYKMLMPIAKLPVRNSKDGNGAMPFTLGIGYGGTTTSQPAANTSGRSPGMTSGGGRSGGRGFSGRGGGASGSRIENSADNNQSAAESELYWIKDVKLATSK